MDVAHFATEVAQRCQLKLTGERNTLFPCFGFQITGKNSEVLNLFSVLRQRYGDEEKIRAARAAGALPVIVGLPDQKEGVSFDEAVEELSRILPLPGRQGF